MLLIFTQNSMSRVAVIVCAVSGTQPGKYMLPIVSGNQAGKYVLFIVSKWKSASKTHFVYSCTISINLLLTMMVFKQHANN
jgi:hypothetical protein